MAIDGEEVKKKTSSSTTQIKYNMRKGKKTGKISLGNTSIAEPDDQ